VRKVKHEGKSENTDCNLELKPQEITVNPGETVNITYSGNVWSRLGCPACIDEVVMGIEDEPFPCIPYGYYGLPGLYPGKEFSGNLSFTAPQTPGTYHIFGVVASEYTPEAAEERYKQHPEWRFQLGTLIVKGAAPGAAPEAAPIPLWKVGVVLLALLAGGAYLLKGGKKE
jgi:hypothetical protein